MSDKVRSHLSKSDRLPEKWFRRGLWLIALVFASFLIGLGGKIVGDLPQTEPVRELESYMPQDKLLKNKQQQKSLEARQQVLQQEQEKAEQALSEQQKTVQTEQENLNNWLAARTATEQSAQNPEVLARTRRLDELREREQQLQKQVDAVQKQQLDNDHASAVNSREYSQLEEQAQPLKDVDDRRIELTVFLYRLALTLPLLLAAGWLFAKQRRSRWWPFVWGFIWFALFAFFVELVPYLPSYGGYVRYVVGIVLTVLIGRYAIAAMNRYLERKQAEEALPQTERRDRLDYDQALLAIGKGICPGCERGLDFTNTQLDFCPHCSIRLFRHCGHCDTRYSAFYRYCFHCGKGDENSAES
ncbi:serine endopeptidase [Conchiformibius steedae DSM 2580]|uniref:Serine endopeptidase n=1 Tax=Conchiformibius steedae DSM 2580 TaxID=1121352 RepID=A0AAE9HSS6_9NEIS|nr:zinc ribbon domain-containing protein [Conchiformibius steedae]QMT34236.1 serine endopeptidase [Conchiformibius steedae]URD67009.1 serine endopeptidase [Conchiformibius steedae DSM 2580]